MLGDAGGLDIVRLDGDGPDEFRQRGRDIDPADVKARADAIGEDDPSDMFFTSGTTGRPKGAITTHGQNVRVYEAWSSGVGLQRAIATWSSIRCSTPSATRPACSRA